MGVSGPPQPEKGHYVSQNGLKLPILCKTSVHFRLGGSVHAPPILFGRCRMHQSMFHSMIGMIVKAQNKSTRHFLTFRIKLTLLPSKTYVTTAPRPRVGKSAFPMLQGIVELY